MKIIALAVIASAALGLAAALVLNSGVQRTAYEAYATSGARVGDPGDNLVGPRWTGNRG